MLISWHPLNHKATLMTDKSTITSDAVLNTLNKSLMAEQQKNRRWRNIRFFSFLGFILVIYLIAHFSAGYYSSKRRAMLEKTPYVALIRLSGAIMPGQGFSAQNVIPSLTRAFKDKKAKGVILDINSPGGTPVQASLIYDRIMALKKQYKKKVVVVGEDMLASGAYWVSMAADKIYVNPNTVTGSIGVVAEGFGFKELINKWGIQRRVFTAGEHKVRLDPFQALKPEDVVKIKSILHNTDQHFISVVMKSRKHLQGDKKALFSGDFWLGDTAVKLGLADGLGSIYTVMPKEFKVKHYLDYSKKPSLLRRLMGGISTQLHIAYNQAPLQAINRF